MAKSKDKGQKPDSNQPDSKRMKMICHRQGLLSACQLVSAAVSARDVKPVLRNIKAVSEGERCTLMATDLELGIRLDVRGVKVEEPGAALLPCGRLLAILRETTDEELTVESGPEKVLVRGFTSEFDMPGEDVAAFPDVPAFAEATYHEISARVLRDLIRRTVFAAATEPGRLGATTGILWELIDDQATLVATDGRRLAVMHGPARACGGHSTSDRKAPPVVPCKAMNLLARSLTDPDEMVRVSFRENDVLMQTGQTVIYSRLVEGRFPAYQQVIPKNHVHSVPLAAGPLLTAIRQASIMTDESVRFRFARQKLTLQAKGAESGQSYVELPVDYDGNKGAEIAFNPTFIADMLRTLEPDAALTLEMSGDKPAVFRHEPSYLYVTVPLVPDTKA